MVKKEISKKIIADSYNSVAKKEKPLDDEEKELLEDWKNINHNDIIDIPTKEKKKVLNDFKKAQSNYKKQYGKDVVLNIRVNSGIITKIKEKSVSVGLNYQTYINSILHQIANDNIDFKIFYNTKKNLAQ
jgi:predicted DNA binding CopG/RHH family protein